MQNYKTWKREIAGSLALWLVSLASYTAYAGTDEVRLSVLGLFTIPVLGMLAGLLGLDAYQKQDMKKMEYTRKLTDEETDRIVKVEDEAADAESDRIIRPDDESDNAGNK